MSRLCLLVTTWLLATPKLTSPLLMSSRERGNRVPICCSKHLRLQADLALHVHPRAVLWSWELCSDWPNPDPMCIPSWTPLHSPAFLSRLPALPSQGKLANSPLCFTQRTSPLSSKPHFSKTLRFSGVDFCPKDISNYFPKQRQFHILEKF